ncbi:Amidohydrolase 2 [Pleurostoma richardsiae]|uniref:Amidohydrolase 2 n=1 Tax=Pleurostoma richardsiae TaxID=41990 RepID=A0AA38VCA1_9PEZI|nr:Amidohydrolase 2 [Pleurostoma richardsiae]
MDVPLITLEEHFFSEAGLQPEQADYIDMFQAMPNLMPKLRDVGPLRLQNMDAGSVSLQVISHGPSHMDAEHCRAANDQLGAAVAANPHRFAGFAVLPMAEPRDAADELRRCVKDMKFVGALVDNHDRGKYYDGDEYDVFWAAAQDLDVPVYLHPTFPTEAMLATQYTGNFPEIAGLAIGSFGLGWHSDTAVHILRLFAAGVFDRFPKVKIVIGHMGELLPFVLDRVVRVTSRFGRERDFKDVWDENIWITTSGVWSVAPMACLLRNTRAEHIMYSVDYPFSSNEDGLRFLKDLRGSGLVTEEQFSKIAYENAEALLKVKARRLD